MCCSRCGPLALPGSQPTHSEWADPSEISPPRPIPPSACWMNEWHVPSRCGGLAWWWCSLWVGDGGWWLMVVVMGQQRSHHRRSRKRSRSVVDDDEGHLIYHRGDMLRARCIEYIPLFFSVNYLYLFCYSLVLLWCTVAKYPFYCRHVLYLGG